MNKKLSRDDKILLAYAKIEKEKRECLKSLSFFVRRSWKVIEPATPLVWNWHIEAICDHVQAFLEGKLEKQNLIINVPPGSMKSTIVSVCAPAWMWLKNPSWQGIFASGSESVGMRDSLKCRDIITSEWYLRTFCPEWVLDKSQNEKGFFKNSAKGFRKVFTAGGRVTGERGHNIFIDDPNDAQAIYSDAHRERVNELWFDSAMTNRLNDMEKGGICLIMQRLHDEDLTGHILKKHSSTYENLVIRSEKMFSHPEPKTSIFVNDPRTQEGEIFFPERYSPTVLENEKRGKGTRNYNGQYLQIIAPASGNIILENWLVCDTYNIQREWEIYVSVDATFKDTKDSDYVAISVWGIDLNSNKFYLIDMIRERLGYVALKNTIKEIDEKYEPLSILIEDKANGSAIIDEMGKNYNLIAITPKESKVARTYAITPILEAKRVHLLRGEWNKDFIEECKVFPNGAHDDQVDSMTQFLNWADNRVQNMLMADYANMTNRY